MLYLGFYDSITLRRIGRNAQRISKLQHHEDQYNWQGLEFPLAIQKLGKFEKKNLDIAVNVQYNNKKGIRTARGSNRNGKCSKQADLLMIVDGNIRHYTEIKNTSRLLKSLNASQKGTYQFYINCLNDCQVKIKIKVKMFSEKEK